MSESTLFWTLVAATCVVCAVSIRKVAVRPRAGLELPFLASAMWAYFYVYMALGVGTRLALIVPDWALELGQFVALAALLGLLVGWRIGMRKQSRAKRSPVYHPGRLWWVGMGLIGLGASAYSAFLRQSEVNWQGTTAYWYLIFHLIYPGSALCLAARALAPRYRQPMFTVLFALAVAAALAPHVITARRGPLFPMVMVFVLIPPMARNVEPRRITTVGLLAAAGLAMLLFVAVRPVLYRAPGSEITYEYWTEALTTVTVQDVLTKRTTKETDNEYLFHCGLVGTCVERESYQYGTGYLSLLTHWIPRQWWPGKPTLGQGWFPDAVTQVPLVMGWGLSAGGSVGGAAEVFNQFGMASPLFWMAIGIVVATAYRRASTGNLRWQLSYVGFACATHWLVSQGFAAAFVPAAIYQVVPFVALKWAEAAPKPTKATVPARTAIG